MKNPLKNFWQTLAIVALPSFLTGAALELLGLTNESVTAAAVVLIAVTLSAIAAQYIVQTAHKRGVKQCGSYFERLYMQIIVSQTISLLLIIGVLVWGYAEGIVAREDTQWLTAIKIGGGCAIFAALLVWRQNSELYKQFSGQPAMVFSMYYYVPLCMLMLGSMAPNSSYLVPLALVGIWAALYTLYVRGDRRDRRRSFSWMQ